MLKVLTEVLEKNTNNTTLEQRTLESFFPIVARMTDPKTLGWAGHVTHTKEIGKA